MELKKGSKAPEFLKLKKYLGTNKILALYFYPKDDTLGCTKEACSLRDGFSELKKKGISILGVSPDSEESHKDFSKKYHLTFPLISDTEKHLSNKYGVWREKSMYGRKYMGIVRKTFLIDKNGKIIYIIDKVDTENHAKQILDVLKNE